MTEERILQISNNCSEEFTDHGATDFATKAELCAAIMYWQTKAADEACSHQLLKSVVIAKMGELLMLTIGEENSCQETADMPN